MAKKFSKRERVFAARIDQLERELRAYHERGASPAGQLTAALEKLIDERASEIVDNAINNINIAVDRY